MTCPSLKESLRRKAKTYDCPSCEGKLIYKEGKYGGYYGCENFPKCKASHSIHQDTGELLGIPADQETRKKRIQAHKVFDKLWRSGEISRSEAYKFLQKTLHLPAKDAHISHLSIDECDELIHQVGQWFGVEV